MIQGADMLIIRPDSKAPSMQTNSSELISELLMGMRLFGVQFRRIEIPNSLGLASATK